MAQPQLKLVTDPAPGFNAAPQDATRQVFEHWVFMLGKSINVCKLGATRRAAINTALAWGYDIDTLRMAIEGMAADPMEWARNDEARKAFRELHKVLETEARIEHWAEMGEALRDNARQQAETASKPQQVQTAPIDHAAEAAARDRLRAMAAQLRGARHG